MIGVVVHQLPVIAPISDEFERWSHILRRPLPRYATTFAFTNILPASINCLQLACNQIAFSNQVLISLCDNFRISTPSSYEPRSSFISFLFIVDDYITISIQALSILAIVLLIKIRCFSSFIGGFPT